MKSKSVLLSVCLLIALGITKIAHDAKLRPTADGIESPSAKAQPFKRGPRAEMSPPPEPIPGITMYDRIEDAPAWTIRYGKEFWKRPQTEASASGPGTQANFDIGDVIGRVSHAVRRDDASGLPTLNANTYTAVFTERGFTITPHAYVGEAPLPASHSSQGKGERSQLAMMPVYEPDLSAASEFETTLVRAGDNILYAAPVSDTPSSFIGNTGQRLLNAEQGLIEHFEAEANGVEVTWILDQRPPEGAAFDVSFRLTGLSVLRAEVNGGYILGDATGNAKVRISEATLVDAAGTKMSMPLELTDGQFNIHVPEPTLARLAFPIAIDPTVGPAVELTMARATEVQHEPSVAWNGNVSQPQYLVVWQDARNYATESREAIYATRVLPSGRVVDTSGIRISSASLSGSSVWPRVASNGDDWLVAWEYWVSGSNNDIYGARVTAGGTVGGHFTICNDGNYQRAPYVGAAGTNYFVAWLDSRHGFYGTAEDVFGARIPIGTNVYPANGAGICLADWRHSNGNVAGRNRARVAGNGTDFLVVWDGWKPNTSFVNVYGSKISPSGSTNWSVTTGSPGCSALLDGGDMMAGFPSVAGQNGTWFVAWEEGRDVSGCFESEPIAKIIGALLSVDGSSNLVVGANVALTRTNSGWNYPDCTQEHSPVVAGNGSAYMVAWTTSDANHQIVGGRVSAAGAALDVDGFVIANTPETELDFAIAGSPGTSDYMFVWAGGNVTEPEPGAGHSLDIFASRISSNAPPSNVRDRFLVSTATVHPVQYNPAVSGDNPCVVVWEQIQGGSNFEIYGSRLATDGSGLDPNGIAIATNASNDLRPAIAGVGAGKLVVWDRGGVVYGRLVEQNSGNVVLGSELTIRNTGGSTAQLPSVAFNDSSSPLNWLVVWEENTTGYWQIKGATVTWTGSGSPTVNTHFSLHQATSSYKRNPSVGSDNSKYLVAWEDVTTSDIHGQMVTTSGTLSGSQVTIASSSFNPMKVPSIAGRAGTGFIVVYEDRPYTGSDTSNIAGVPVSTSGTVGTASLLASTNGIQQVPSIGNNGSTTFLATWTIDQMSSGFDVQACRLSIVSGGGGSLTLNVADPNGFVLNNQLSSTQIFTSVGASSANTDYVVAYEHSVPTIGSRIRANIIVP